MHILWNISHDLYLKVYTKKKFMFINRTFFFEEDERIRQCTVQTLCYAKTFLWSKFSFYDYGYKGLVFMELKKMLLIFFFKKHFYLNFGNKMVFFNLIYSAFCIEEFTCVTVRSSSLFFYCCFNLRKYRGFVQQMLSNITWIQVSEDEVNNTSSSYKACCVLSLNVRAFLLLTFFLWI